MKAQFDFRFKQSFSFVKDRLLVKASELPRHQQQKVAAVLEAFIS
jgi:hypothetical protein